MQGGNSEIAKLRFPLANNSEDFICNATDGYFTKAAANSPFSLNQPFPPSGLKRDSSLPIPKGIMSKEDRYLIESPTMAMFDEDGRHVSQTVPAGSIIVVDGKTLNGDKLIPVLWADKPVFMFTQDIRRRGKRLEDGAA